MDPVAVFVLAGVGAVCWWISASGKKHQQEQHKQDFEIDKRDCRTYFDGDTGEDVSDGVSDEEATAYAIMRSHERDRDFMDRIERYNNAKAKWQKVIDRRKAAWGND